MHQTHTWPHGMGHPQALIATARRGLASVALGVAFTAWSYICFAGTWSERPASEWLEKMARASQSLNYDGTFVYRNGDRMESMRIIHRATPGGERERMFSLTGAAREVLRDSEKVTCILPDNRSVVVTKSRPRSVTLRVFDPQDGFAKHYDLSSQPGERVAGRKTALIKVKPKDEYRYGYRLWLDRVTGLLLKSELVGDGGRALEQIVYTDIKMPAYIPDELLEPAISGEGFTWYTDSDPMTPAAMENANAWSVGWLPRGFEMTDRVIDPSSLSRMPIEHLVYTDGLASVSVFIERLSSAAEGIDGHSNMGAINAYGRVLGDHQITVVGEVPSITVERVADSVQRR
ncbi:MAG: MucB/RseB C-terminal domain-containing protein [Gammaproteobacteria bacterium]|nr:MucB/RseB C-terminal domain-containing protein [Gammaproteobacteria bacterium]